MGVPKEKGHISLAEFMQQWQQLRTELEKLNKNVIIFAWHASDFEKIDQNIIALLNPAFISPALKKIIQQFYDNMAQYEDILEYGKYLEIRYT